MFSRNVCMSFQKKRARSCPVFGVSKLIYLDYFLIFVICTKFNVDPKGV